MIALKERIEAGKVPGMTDFFGEIFADDVHLTDKGRYLISLVHYACIYRESPEAKVSLEKAGLSAEQAGIFQQIAWQTARDYKWSGVTMRNRDAKLVP